MMSCGGQKNKANQSQFISVQCFVFSYGVLTDSGQRQDEEKGFEKTKPISRFRRCPGLPGSVEVG